jgi:alpha/beta superfamily hydrolase
MARRIESLFLPGPAGRLEALLEEPEDADPVEAALVCHPHPLHGGTMHNKVVYRLARGLRQAGCVVLRFNYRGVNLSEGVYDNTIGETEDARVALYELRARYSYLPILAAGFSFGSRIALRLASSEKVVGRVIPVGFPTVWPDRSYIDNVTVPKIFIHSTHDNFGPRPAFEQFFESVPEPKRVEWIEAEDHFFKDALDRFESVVRGVGLARATDVP